jgi:hypothetical protein
MSTYKLCVAAGLVLCGLALGAATTTTRSEFSHAGGFVCGMLGASNNRIVGGDYRTNFNIRNPSDKTVVVDLDLALGFPSADPAANGQSFTPGAMTSLQSVTLRPGEAVMIDCDELLAAAMPLDTITPPPYFSGILDIRSSQPLQVVRTQTAGPNGEDVSTLSVSEIAAVRTKGGDDDDDV